ncbi:hypothetical protein HZA87_06330 [Candidatus Uhrbacteria bacterium]|nr:hypothetical protein [Candidatus Uhrbacteria bacterium]
MRFLLMSVLMAGCVGFQTDEREDNECQDCDDKWILIVAEDLDQSATLTVEFAERESQVGQLGWHLTLDCPDVVELYTSPDELQDMLDDRGYNVIVDNTECIRWNVNYQDGRALCEGNDNTPYEADLITDTDLNWSGETWEVDTWSDPSGAGCSALACLPS